MISLTKLIVPAAWMTYLFYGEGVDLEDWERAECDRLKREYGEPAYATSVGFTWHPDYGEPGECEEVAFIKTDS